MNAAAAKKRRRKGFMIGEKISRCRSAKKEKHFPLAVLFSRCALFIIKIVVSFFSFARCGKNFSAQSQQSYLGWHESHSRELSCMEAACCVELFSGWEIWMMEQKG